MAKAVTISRDEMHDFLIRRGFIILTLEGTKELVYGRIVAPNLSLRVYTSIEGACSRSIGSDAIRTVLVTRINGRGPESTIKIVGGDRRVHRVEGWRENLQDRLDGWRDQLGPVCHKCGRMTVRRESRRGPFWGCSGYPECKSITPMGGGLVREPLSQLSERRGDMNFDEEG